MAVLSSVLTLSNVTILSLTPDGTGTYTCTASQTTGGGVQVTITATKIPTASANQLATGLTTPSPLTVTIQ